MIQSEQSGAHKTVDFQKLLQPVTRKLVDADI